MAKRIRYCLRPEYKSVIWASLTTEGFNQEPRRITPLSGQKYLLDLLEQGSEPYDFSYKIRLFLPNSCEIVVGWVHESCLSLTSFESLYDGRFNSDREGT